MPDLNYGVAYSGVRAFAAEGARCGLVTCQSCGAVLMLDPDDTLDVRQVHTTWHASIARHEHFEGDDE